LYTKLRTKKMTTIKHKFRDHKINPLTEILVVGTFNPETVENIAEFFTADKETIFGNLSQQHLLRIH